MTVGSEWGCRSSVGGLDLNGRRMVGRRGRMWISRVWGPGERSSRQIVCCIEGIRGGMMRRRTGKGGICAYVFARHCWSGTLATGRSHVYKASSKRGFREAVDGGAPRVSYEGRRSLQHCSSLLSAYHMRKIKMGNLFGGQIMIKAHGNECESRVAPEVMNFRNAL